MPRCLDGCAGAPFVETRDEGLGGRGSRATWGQAPWALGDGLFRARAVQRFVKRKACGRPDLELFSAFGAVPCVVFFTLKRQNAGGCVSRTP